MIPFIICLWIFYIISKIAQYKFEKYKWFEPDEYIAPSFIFSLIVICLIFFIIHGGTLRTRRSKLVDKVASAHPYTTELRTEVAKFNVEAKMFSVDPIEVYGRVDDEKYLLGKEKK